jgi:5-formyltetrahydrofolate cyclo-ligase
LTKAELRVALLERAVGLSPDERTEASNQAQERIVVLPEYESAEIIALYSSLPTEVGTDLLFRRARADGKRVVFPGYAEANGAPELREVTEIAELEPGPHGFLHPPHEARVPVAQVSLCIVPGLGFDRRGWRLGRGKGYYDRLLAGRRPRSHIVGLCFEHALLDHIEAEPHDVAVDYVATPSELWRAARPGNTR